MRRLLSDARSSSRRRPLLTVTLCLVALAIASALLLREVLVGDPAQSEPPSPPLPSMSTEERAFYKYVAPRLAALAAESHVLAGVAEERNRNLLDLQARGARVESLVDDVAGYARDNSVPDRFRVAYDLFVQGSTVLVAAMGDARDAFVQFDWGRVAELVPIFQTGSADIERAVAVMEEVGGSDALASPVASYRISWAW